MDFDEPSVQGDVLARSFEEQQEDGGASDGSQVGDVGSGGGTPFSRVYSDAERRAMQPSVSDVEDDDDMSQFSSESEYSSEEDSVHGDDLFADADDDFITAWEKLGEDFVRHIAEQGAHHLFECVDHG